MAATTLTVEVRCRRLWLLRLAKVFMLLPMPRQWRHAAGQWLWAHVCYEYRVGREWKRLPQPRLEID